MSKFPEDFYVFATPRDDPQANSHIKIMEGEYAGITFVVNWIKIRKKYFDLFGKYVLKYNYTVVENSQNPADMKKLPVLIGQIIEDVWEKYYS